MQAAQPLARQALQPLRVAVRLLPPAERLQQTPHVVQLLLPLLAVLRQVLPIEVRRLLRAVAHRQQAAPPALQRQVVLLAQVQR